MTNDHERLSRLLRGHPQGFSRLELAERLDLSDRVTRQLIEDVVANGLLPVVSDRTHGEGRYRLAGRDEIDLINQEHSELLSRAMSLHRRAKGLLNAFQTHYSGGALFMPATPEVDA